MSKQVISEKFGEQLFQQYLRQRYPSGISDVEVRKMIRHAFFTGQWATLGTIKRTPSIALANVLNDMVQEAEAVVKDQVVKKHKPKIKDN